MEVVQPAKIQTKSKADAIQLWFKALATVHSAKSILPWDSSIDRYKLIAKTASHLILIRVGEDALRTDAMKAA